MFFVLFWFVCTQYNLSKLFDITFMHDVFNCSKCWRNNTEKEGINTWDAHTHTSSLYTFWSCSWRGVADGGSQLFHTKLALGRHVCTKRLTITCKHTLAHTHRHIWATCSPGTQLELHGVTLSPSPRTPSYPHSTRGQVSHSGSHTWIGPRCQLCLSWHTDT